jgi:hypothetical protein
MMFPLAPMPRLPRLPPVRMTIFIEKSSGCCPSSSYAGRQSATDQILFDPCLFLPFTWLYFPTPSSFRLKQVRATRFRRTQHSLMATRVQGTGHHVTARHERGATPKPQGRR